MSNLLETRLPIGWQIRTIGDVSEFVRGVTYQKSQSRTALEDGYIALIRATNISDEKITYDEFVYVPEKVVKKEQRVRLNDMILAASSGSSSVVGKSAPVLVDYVATFGAFCAVLRPSEKILARYFHLFVQSPTVRETWSALARGTNINNLKREQALGTEFPVPPLAEQEKIVEVLEEQLSRLDAALTSVRTVREKAAQFRRSLLHAAFTGALTGHDASFGALPAGWTRSTIGDVANVVGGRTPSKFEHRLGETVRSDRKVPFFKVGDMNATSRYLEESRVYFAESEANGFGIEILKVGTVIFPKAGGAIATNKKRILKRPGAIDLNCMGISPTGALDGKLLYWFFESFNLTSLADGTVLPQISKKKVSELGICFPTNVGDQTQLLDQIEACISKSESVDAVAEAVEKKAAALRRSLLHAAFTGELTREWRVENHV